MGARNRHFILIVIALGTFALVRAVGGARAGHEGELWLKEKPEARNTYAIGYTQGFSEGVEDVCQQALVQAQASFALADCLNQNLKIPNTTELAKQVTEFYLRFPGDRYLYITDVMHALGRGMTLEQIHQNAGGGGVRTSQ